MAVVVTDKDNFIEHAQPRVDEIRQGQPVQKEPVKDDKAKPNEKEEAAKAEDIEALDPEDREDKLITDYVKRKIGKKHRAMKEAQEERDEANRFAETQFHERRLVETRAQQLERELAELKAKVQPTPEVQEDLEPQDTDEKYKDNPKAYWQDWAKWSARQELSRERKAATEREQKEIAAKADEARIERNRAFAAKTPDFEQKMAELAERGDIRVPKWVEGYVYESPQSAEVMYHFATHPEVFERISSLSPIMGLAELGKLASTLTPKAETKTETKVEEVKANGTKAPEPIKPLSGADTGTVHKPRSEWTTRETIDYEEAQRAHKSQRRQRH